MIRTAKSRLQHPRAASTDRVAAGVAASETFAPGFPCGADSTCPFICSDQIHTDSDLVPFTAPPIESEGSENMPTNENRQPNSRRAGHTRGSSANPGSRCLALGAMDQEQPSFKPLQRQQPGRQPQAAGILGDVTSATMNQLPPKLAADAKKILSQTSAIEPVEPLRNASRANCDTAVATTTVDARGPWPQNRGQPLPQPPPPAAGAYCHAAPAPTLIVGSLLPASVSREATADVDAMRAMDPQLVVEYEPDILRAMQREEADGLPLPNYMENQPSINAKMRSILIDWLVDVHRKYKLRPETLFLAKDIIDRYLEKRVTERKYLQLVGATALLVAAKYEETYPPKVKDFVFVTDKAYSEDEVQKMEISILIALKFKVCQPTAAQFMDCYAQVNGCSETHRHLAQYLLELTLCDYRMVKWCPSHLAAAVILLSNKLLRRQPSWPQAAVKYTTMTEQMLKECAKEVCVVFEAAETNALQAVRKKFSQQKYQQVAKLTLPAQRSNAASATTAGSEGKQRSSKRTPGASTTPAVVAACSGADAAGGRCFAPRELCAGAPQQFHADIAVPTTASGPDDAVLMDA